jgi:hypothetical protein
VTVAAISEATLQVLLRKRFETAPDAASKPEPVAIRLLEAGATEPDADRRASRKRGLGRSGTEKARKSERSL